MNSSDSGDAPLLPDDSPDDPELGFGDEPELLAEPLAADDDSLAEPASLSEDANVSLDVEPDPEIGADVNFDEAAPSLDAGEDEPPLDDDEEDRHALELKSVRAELDGLKEERAQLVEKNNELEDKLANAAGADELKRLEYSLKEERKKHSDAEQEIKRLQNELKSANAKVEKFEAASEDAEDVPEDTQKELDLMDAQIKALQTENTQLKDALGEAQSAESRTEHAHDTLSRNVKELQDEVEGLRAELDAARQKLEEQVKENENLNREIAVARKELADQRDAAQDVEQRSVELDDRKAELDAVTRSLAEAKEEIERLTPFEAEIQRVEGLEDRITELQHELVAKEKESAELQEKLDSEAARSYRLSQRRIPALNAELEAMQESSRELERKLQKSELKADTFEEQSKELQAKIDDLERALRGAKARAQDTAIIEAGDTDAESLVTDEVRRLTNRMEELEEERGRLAERLRRLSEAHTAELKQHEARANRLEQETDERYESLLKQRTQLRVMKERMSGMLKLAEDLNTTAQNQRQPLLETLRKLADVPPDTN